MKILRLGLRLSQNLRGAELTADDTAYRHHDRRSAQDSRPKNSQTHRSSGLFRLLDCQSGSIAVMAGFMISALTLGTAIAVDYANMITERSTLQSVADAASIAAAREMTLANADASALEVVAGNMVAARTKLDATKLSITVNVDRSAASVEVIVEENLTLLFAHLFSDKMTKIKVRSTALVFSAAKICVLALDQSASGAIALSGEARLTANGCGVYSNSSSTTGLASYKNSLIEASLICSSGGTGGGTSNFEPSATTDCPPMPDPLAGRAAPTVGLCDHDEKQVTGGTETLYPGTYCGGLLVGGDSVVTFAPGVYVIKDGSFEITKTASITGEHVGFYLTGDNAVFLFADTTSADLSAPKDGPMAGLLFFEDRNAPLGRVHEIVSENARNIVGTIYLPRGHMNVSSKKPVADKSAYTAIIAQKIALNRYPRLILNSDYQLTDIPVPAGLSGAGGRVVLAK